MERHRNKLRLATIVLFCLVNLGFGLCAGQLPMLLAGGVGLVYVASVAIAAKGSPASVRQAF